MTYLIASCKKAPDHQGYIDYGEKVDRVFISYCGTTKPELDREADVMVFIENLSIYGIDRRGSNFYSFLIPRTNKEKVLEKLREYGYHILRDSNWIKQ